MPGLVIATLLLYVVCGVLAGVLWAKVTSKVPLPQWLLALAAPIAAGAVAFVLLVGISYLRFGSSVLGSSDFRISAASGGSSQSQGSFLGFAFRSALGAGILVGGLPAVLSFGLARRRAPQQRQRSSDKAG